MAGPSEVASGFIDSLKSQPLSLALVAMNLALLTLMYYQYTTEHTQRLEMAKIIFELQKNSQNLLANCIPPGSKTNLQLEGWKGVPLPQSAELPSR